MSIRIFQFEKDYEKIKIFSTWLGKSLVMDLLILLIERINTAFESDKNGWHFQDVEKVNQLKTQMSILLNQKWTGVEKKEEEPQLVPTIEV
jgi:hypothetical protein